MLENLPDAIGHALRNQRAGLDSIAFNLIDLRQGTAALQVASLAFADHAPIPVPYTADGAGLSPPLQWTGVPAGAASLALIVEDADAPTPRPLVHAIVVDLPPADGALAQGTLDSDAHEGGDALRVGRNSYLQTGWIAPDPPPGHGPHRYAFQLFALAEGPPFSSDTPGREALLDALRDRAIASGCLIGTYERHDTSVRSDDAVAAPVALGPLAAA
jgi:Raf kinase inhibitor-like YbhB/YbcL family protein